MTKIRVTVTQDDIDNGKPRNAFSCPITIAVNRKLSVTSSSVSSSTFTYYDKENDRYIRYCMSKRASKFIRQFDSGKAVKPFIFYAFYATEI